MQAVSYLCNWWMVKEENSKCSLMLAHNSKLGSYCILKFILMYVCIGSADLT